MEASEIGPLIQQIQAFPEPRRRAVLEPEIELSLSSAIPLLPGLAASTRGLLTRQLLRVCRFDERRLANWRLEHKLVQALVFRHYFAASLPRTYGFRRLAHSLGTAGLRHLLPARFPTGFVIKPALGDSTGNDCDSRTEGFLRWIENRGGPAPVSGQLTEEEFIVQERQMIRHEYRVHTVEDRVIEDLTVRRHAGAVGPGERKAPNDYVQGILNALPAGITAGAILGWDVALTAEGCCSTIEINIGDRKSVV